MRAEAGTTKEMAALSGERGSGVVVWLQGMGNGLIDENYRDRDFNSIYKR